MVTYGVADSHPQPMTTTSPPAMTTDSVIAAVRDYVSQNDLASAIDLLRPYSQSPLTHPTLFSDFLVILTWSGQRSEAIERFESLPDTFPERAYLLRNMAKAYYDERAFAKAETLYHRALAMAPDDDAAFNGLVAALMGQGRTDEALRTLENGGDGKDSLSRGLLKARLLIDHQEDARALNWYDRLILKFPDSMLAIARERDDRMAGLAIDRQETVLAQYKARLKDRLPSDIENYILCLVLFRRYNVALTAMDDWDLLPAATPAHKAYWYAWAYYKSNRITEAEAQFRYIIDNEPAYFPAQIGLAYCLVAVHTLPKLKAGWMRYPGNMPIILKFYSLRPTCMKSNHGSGIPSKPMIALSRDTLIILRPNGCGYGPTRTWAPQAWPLAWPPRRSPRTAPTPKSHTRQGPRPHAVG